MGEALEGYMEMAWAGQPTNSDLSYWLSNFFSSAAQDDNDFGDDTIDEAHFVTLATKLGVSETDARAAFADKDVDGSGRLSTSEQDEIWAQWISDGITFSANTDFVPLDGGDGGDGDGEGEGEGDGDGEGEGDGDADGEGEGDGDADGEGEGDGDADGEGEGEGDGDGEGEGEGDGDGDGEGEGDGDGEGEGDGDGDGEGEGGCDWTPEELELLNGIR